MKNPKDHINSCWILGNFRVQQKSDHWYLYVLTWPNNNIKQSYNNIECLSLTYMGIVHIYI